MMKYFFSLLFVLAVGLPAVFRPQSATFAQTEVGGQKEEPAKTPIKVPAEIKVILKVEEMPGIEKPKSFWEGVYEIRVADWGTIVENMKSGADAEDSGAVLLQSSFASRGVSEKENRSVTI